MNRYLWNFYWDWGREGDIQGLFVATEKDIKNIIGKVANFGECLGKYSEIYGTIEEDEIKKIDLDCETVEKISKLLGDTWCGYNPLNYIFYYCPICHCEILHNEYNHEKDICIYCEEDNNKNNASSIKTTVKNKYNLKFSDIKKLKITDRTKICKPLFWRNDVAKVWCISENTAKTKQDIEFGTYNDYWIGIYDEGLTKKTKLSVYCNAFGGMATYKFNKFFDFEEIENKHDLEIQEKLLTKINYLIDEGILSLPD